MLFVTSLNATLNSGDVANEKLAKTAAEACAELALQKLTSGASSPCTSLCSVTQPLAQGQCVVDTITGTDATGWVIRAQGQNAVNPITKYLEIKALRTAPGVPAVVTSWRECLDSTSPCLTP